MPSGALGAPRVAFLLAIAATACGSTASVERVYDGRIVEGRFVGPDAYSAFLQRVLAEPIADARSALPEAGRWAHVTREALVSTTVVAPAPAAAWELLGRWAAMRNDVALWTYALRGLSRALPAKREDLARAAETLAGVGEVAEARALAAAVVERGEEWSIESRHPLAARLALDEAIARGDTDTVRLCASRVHVSLDEAAARALLGGRREIARDLASELVGADPSATGADLVKGAAEGRDPPSSAHRVRADASPVPSAVLVAFGEVLVRWGATPEDRTALARIPHEPFRAGDDPVNRVAVGLVAKGVLAMAELPPDGAVEWAAIRVRADLLPPSALLDPRHVYLALAVAHPRESAPPDLRNALHTLVSEDPVVAAADGLFAVASDATVAPVRASKLLAAFPSDPLVASVALRMAKRSGDRDAACRARSVLRGLGVPTE